MSEIDLTPDPRISTLRPAWLTDDEAWRDQLQAMQDDDWRWIERQWELAGGARPSVDTSWIRMETVGGFGIWPLVLAVVLVAIPVSWVIWALAGR